MKSSMKDGLKLIFNPKNESDKVQEKVIGLQKEEPISATFSMFDDAIKKNSDVYKLKKPIKPKGKIPHFLFL